MNVITQAGTVWCGVVFTKYFYRCPFPGSHLQDQRDQVGLRLMPFTDVALSVCPRRIEITQAALVHLGGLADIVQNMLNGELGSAVGVAW